MKNLKTTPDYKETVMTDDQLLGVNGGTRVDQYEVKVGGCYWIYFPMHEGFSVEPYGARSGNTYRICVYEVFEADGILWGLFGTNRTIRGIDIDNGEYVEVRINSNNVYTMDDSGPRID